MSSQSFVKVTGTPDSAFLLARPAVDSRFIGANEIPDTDRTGGRPFSVGPV